VADLCEGAAAGWGVALINWGQIPINL